MSRCHVISSNKVVLFYENEPVGMTHLFYHVGDAAYPVMALAFCCNGDNDVSLRLFHAGNAGPLKYWSRAENAMAPFANLLQSVQSNQTASPAEVNMTFSEHASLHPGRDAVKHVFEEFLKGQTLHVPEHAIVSRARPMFLEACKRMQAVVDDTVRPGILSNLVFANLSTLAY